MMLYTLLVTLTLSAALPAQPPADFSGKWTLDAPAGVSRIRSSPQITLPVKTC